MHKLTSTSSTECILGPRIFVVTNLRVASLSYMCKIKLLSKSSHHTQPLPMYIVKNNAESVSV